MTKGLGQGSKVTVRLDNAGRLLLPRSVMEQYGLAPDAEVEVLPTKEGLFLRPLPRRETLVKVDGL